MQSDNGKQERHYTANIMVGNLALEYFFTSSIFKTNRDSANPTFTEEHSHANYELLICKNGSGYQFVNQCAHLYNNGAVFLFAPFTKHAHISSGAQSESRYSFRFQPAKEQPAGKDSRPAVEAVFKHLDTQGYVSFTAGALLLRMLEELLMLMEKNAGDSRFLVNGIVALIFSAAFQQVEDMLGEWPVLQTADWSAVSDHNYRRFLIDHFFDQLVNRNARIEDLCQQVHLSQNQLNRVIRDMFGMTFKQKLTEVRIAYIQYFLKYSTLSINEIAQQTNFLENSNFSLFFKQHCGECPSHYRAREQRSVPEK